MKQNQNREGQDMQLIDFLAKSCHYAQEHVGDPDAWPMDGDNREYLLQCVSFQVACFLSQNTVHGREGVDWGIVIGELTDTDHPVKSEQYWKKTINKIAKEFGGWKKS
jgi:hypothetical protein